MSILARYLVAQYLKIFAFAIALTTGLFVLGDFFNRIGDLSSYDSDAPVVISYFLFRVPEALVTTYPAAALMSCLVSLGLLVRHREILAMRACGISTLRLAVPLLSTTALLSVVVLIFNEIVVPPAASSARTVKDISIKKKQYAGAYNSSSLWFQDRQGFFNVEYFDANRQELHGITLYQTDPDLRLQRVIEVPKALWRGDRWELQGGTVRTVTASGDLDARPLEPADLDLTDAPVEFRSKRRRTDEFNYRDLKDQIGRLEARGLDVIEFRVDLYYKLAIPFSGLVSVFFGFPLATRGGRRGNLATNVALGMAVAFAYWATSAVTVALGHNGDLPPLIAAWAGNGIFTVVGALLYLGRDV